MQQRHWVAMRIRASGQHIKAAVSTEPSAIRRWSGHRSPYQQSADATRPRDNTTRRVSPEWARHDERPPGSACQVLAVKRTQQVSFWVGDDRVGQVVVA
jgi:hypothetical protein